MQKETAESIITELIEHYVYIFGAPKTILTDQGQNFLSELMQQFDEAQNIQHIKTQKLIRYSVFILALGHLVFIKI